MENQKSTSKPQIEFGLFYGLAMVLSFVIIYVLNVDPFENPLIGTLSSVFSYLLFPIVFIYMGINAFKKKNQGFASLGECLKTGVTIAFIAALLLAVFNVAFNYVFPEYIEEILNQTKKVMLKQNPSMTSDQIETALSITKKFSSPVFSVPITLLMFSFLGLIYSLIIGLIVRKDRPQFN
ncbi:DUF4199 domain-containing protein [Flavobacterium sp.]|uniref:DUF4199 domain-containing protein n=1 Tax=Flavobacterium sp. TaxID=239 RepID=UPI003D6B0693